MHIIKPIQTHYKGRYFRSRTEARWAVFFDAAGVTWEYEKEGYDLTQIASEDVDGYKYGKYLPDFWLPQYECWVEIKGALPEPHWAVTEEEMKLFYLVRLTSAKAGWIFFGAPDTDIPCSMVRWDPSDTYYPQRPDRNYGTVVDMVNRHPLNAKILEKASSARFEFGETPK